MLLMFLLLLVAAFRRRGVKGGRMQVDCYIISHEGELGNEFPLCLISIHIRRLLPYSGCDRLPG